MFVAFLHNLRGFGVRVSLGEWIGFLEALAAGFARNDVAGFYHLGRMLLVRDESQYDPYDQAFAATFEGVEVPEGIDAALQAWLSSPKAFAGLTPEQLKALQAFGDLDELRRTFLERLKAQKERHDGGSHWVGTGGTSPFGHGGYHPSGIRVGGPGGMRSAVQIAEARRFRNLRSDRVLDVREIGQALRRLRRLSKHGSEEVLDLPASIDASGRTGDIELRFGPERKNNVKLLLLLDVGGSMDPHALLCERLFSAAHQACHFKVFEHYYFHNCIYRRLYRDMEQLDWVPTDEVLRKLDPTWTVMIVGDAWMSPFELLHAGGGIDYFDRDSKTGYAWLEAFGERCPRIVWLNPEPTRVWRAESITLVRRLFPMFELTMAGLTEAVDHLRGPRNL